MEPNPALTVRYGTVDTAYADVLATTPPEDDGPVWMVNLMRYRDVADYADGRETTLTGKQADDAYFPIEALREVGAEIVFAADVDMQLLGDEPQWDRVAVVKYPTRRSFMDMQALESFQTKHDHKDAGMQQTIIIAGFPMATPDLPDDAPDWADVPHPPTDDDGYVAVLHVLKFHEGKADTDMVSYQTAAGTVAVPHGVRLAGWFETEGTPIGDGRSWDQVRFNLFPSKAAFLAVALDPDRLAAQGTHREVAIADTYTMILRPFLDTLADSIAATEPVSGKYGPG